jgi:hypothetical protein
VWLHRGFFVRDDTTLLDEIPEPVTIQRALGRVLRQAAFLRRLLKIALAARDQREDRPVMHRESEADRPGATVKGGRRA